MIDGTHLFSALQELYGTPWCFSRTSHCLTRDMNSERERQTIVGFYKIQIVEIYPIPRCRYVFIKWADGSLKLKCHQ